jgi:hypothetical protein
METEIREQIIRHLAGELTLDELAAWLIEATWDVDQRADHRAAELAYSMQLLFAERDRGHRSDAEVERLLRQIASTARMGENVTVATGSSAVTDAGQITGPGVRWGQAQFVGAGRRSEPAPA